MNDLQAALRSAFEAHGYEVGSASENRDRLRVTVLEADASGEELRSIVHDVVEEDRIRGLNVATEALEGRDAVATVVSFRYRS